jgi:hypothetical protein
MTAFSVVPFRLQRNRRLVLGFRKHLRNLLFHGLVGDADAFHPGPREGFADEKFRLFAPLAVGVFLGVGAGPQ